MRHQKLGAQTETASLTSDGYLPDLIPVTILRE